MRLLTLFCAWSAFSVSLAADALYDVGSNTTFAAFNDALSQVMADHPGPFGVTVRVRALDNSAGPLDLDAGLLPLQPQAAHRLVIEGGPSAQPQLSGAGAYGIRISGVAYVTVQGLRVQGFSVNSLKLANAPDALVQGNNLQGAGAGAVDAQDSPGLRLLGNTLAPSAGTGALVSQCLQAVVQGNVVPAGSAPSYGLVLQGSHNAQLLDNRADGANYAFNLFSAAGVTVTGNVAIGRGRERGLVLDNSPGVLVTRNLLVGQAVGVELQSSTGCAFYQNTVWEHGTAALYLGTGSADARLRNNLWQGFFALFMNSVAQASLSSDNNGFRYAGQLGVGADSYGTLADWQAAGQDAGSIDADPLFTGLNGAQPELFKLQPGSPVRGFGADLSAFFTADFFGNPLQPSPALWDPGIHVVSAVQNTPTMTPTPTMVLPTATPSATATPTVSPTFTPSPVGTATSTPSPTRSFTITPTFTLTPYPFQRERVISYPNPWSPAGPPLNIVFEPADSVTVRIFDMAGELVAELPASALRPRLGHALWDGRDRHGALQPSGLYLAVVSTPQGTRFTRFTVLH